MSDFITFNASTVPMNFELQGFGRLKWNGTQYEFEGDPHESAKVFAEHLLHEVNAGRNRERELVEGLERTTTALEAALEELRLIRMKDCGAVYDNMIRRFGPVAAQDARSLIGGDQ